MGPMVCQEDAGSENMKFISYVLCDIIHKHHGTRISISSSESTQDPEMTMKTGEM